MAKISDNAHAWGDVTQAVYTAAIGAAAPTAPLPTDIGDGWYDLGWLSDSGVTESNTFNETKKYGWQGGGLIRVLRNQFERPHKFQCLEENAVTVGLMRPGSAITVTSGTSEVQTVTLTGTGTAGTFTLSLPGHGTASALTYNITTSALADALNAAFSMSGITVTGTAGSSYVVTFPASAGDLPLMTAVNSITGVTAITVVETTAGQNPIYTQGQGTQATRNMRQWAIDLVDGSVHKRRWFPTAEAILSGDAVYSNTDLTVYEFTLNPYADDNGFFYYDITDDGVYGVNFV